MFVSIHQPAYLPWLGYFERIAMSDIFVFLDTVQFEKNSFTNRNKIKTSSGSTMLTIPVLKQGHMSSTIAQLKIDERSNWRKKHLRSIEQSYQKSLNFKTNWQKFSSLYNVPTDSFCELTFDQLTFWLTVLKIDTKIIRASELDISGKKADLVINICKYLNASKYISGPMGREYLDVQAFGEIGVDLVFHDFVHPTYGQLYGKFTPGMGVIDYWMNDGNTKIFKNMRSVS